MDRKSKRSLIIILLVSFLHQQILHMADGLTMGIINQFPGKFE